MIIPWTEILEFLEILVVCALALGAGYIVLRVIGLFVGFGSDGNDDDKPIRTPYMDKDGNFWDRPPYERRAKEASDRDHYNQEAQRRASFGGTYIDYDGRVRDARTNEPVYMNQTNTPNPKRR